MSIHLPRLTARPATSSGWLRRTQLGLWIALAALAALAASPAVAQAAPPPNDDFADAQAVQLADVVTGSTVGATTEAGEPGIQFNSHTIWYRLVTSAAGPVRIDTCASSSFARVTVYTGDSIGGLTEVAQGQPTCSNGGRAYITATIAATYHISVTGYAGAGDITLAVAAALPPPNDAFADARALTTSERVTGTNLDATSEPGEPVHTAADSQSVWYRLTASATQLIEIDTCAGGGEKSLTVYSGDSVSSLTRLTYTREACASGGAVTFTAAAATTYHVAVTSYADPGDFTLTVSIATPPANDDFANARALRFPERLAATNVDASLEAGEPNPFPTPDGSGNGRSVWYRLTQPTAARVSIATCNGDFFAWPTVYTGTGVANLTVVGQRTAGCPNGRVIDFVAAPNTPYSIAVKGDGARAGEFILDVRAQPPPPPCPAANSPAGAVGYRGTHSRGGMVCLTVLADFSAVASLQLTEADCARLGLDLNRFTPPVPIRDRRFGTFEDRLAGSFPTDRGAQGSVQITRPVFETQTCTGPLLHWTATTTATPPWAKPPPDRTPPALRLRAASVQRPLRRNAVVVGVRCPTEACVASASATVAGVRIVSAARAVRPGPGRTLRLVLSTRARRALAAALRSRRSIRTRLAVVARDAAANRATARRTVTLRR